MRTLNRNKQVIYYCLPEEENVVVVDGDGNRTGERKTIYGEPVMLRINVSAAKGDTDVEMFGIDESYDKILVTHDTDCPIDEKTVLFIDKAPAYTEVMLQQKTGVRPYLAPLYDYVVVRVAKSINSTSYAVKKMPIGGVPVPSGG